MVWNVVGIVWAVLFYGCLALLAGRFLYLLAKDVRRWWRERQLLNPENYDEAQRAPKSEKRQRNAIVSVRMTDSELAQIQQLAELRGIPIATFLRERALSAPYLVVAGTSFSVNAA